MPQLNYIIHLKPPQGHTLTISIQEHAIYGAVFPRQTPKCGCISCFQGMFDKKSTNLSSQRDLISQTEEPVEIISLPGGRLNM